MNYARGNVMARRFTSFFFLLAVLCPPLALADPLEGITITKEVVGDPRYDRSLYGGWIGGCINTRERVLLDESLIEVERDEDDACKLRSGLWYDPYTAKFFTDPGDLDIDHMVPLKETHQSGAHAWDAEKRKAFANDLDNRAHLMAVKAGANRSKSCQDPSEWLPPNEAFACEYVLIWAGIKRVWGLSMDSAERDFILEVLARCDVPPEPVHNRECTP